MATKRWSCSIGEGEFSVLEETGAAVVAKQVELTVEFATTAVQDLGTTRAVKKQEVLDALEKIKNSIIKSTAFLK